jgi:ribosomal protein S6
MGMGDMSTKINKPKTGAYYFVKLDDGVKKTAELKSKIDAFVNKNREKLANTSVQAPDWLSTKLR